MQSYIRVVKTIVDGEKILCEFEVSENLSPYFRKNTYSLSYYRSDDTPLSITGSNMSLAVIPFVANVLPLIFLSDSTLIVDELDRMFHDAIDRLREAFRNYYPKCAWRGSIVVRNLVDNTGYTASRSAAYYSAGVDSTSTLLEHYAEKPDIYTLWGVDIKQHCPEHWAPVHRMLAETAEKLKLNACYIVSDVKSVFHYPNLNAAYRPLLQISWWFGVQHGIAIASHVFPLIVQCNYKIIYLAASISADMTGAEHKKIASRPSIDNLLKAGNAGVIHDGYEKSRMERTRNIIRKAGEQRVPLPLRVCYKPAGKGGNCGHCEKCIRTILTLLAENIDPGDYGFHRNYLRASKPVILYKLTSARQDCSWSTYQELQETLKAQRPDLKDSPELRWLYELDFAKLPSKSRKRNLREKLRIWLVGKFYRDRWPLNPPKNILK